ncbi:DEAD/DEAH box helicase [Odoribacter lunatus]|uniref:DEAD/DEAH box helicase n=1 Tax=Odoribacter lunatus TaxID=2941335 RepID=UPI00203E39B5|nr:DEAD/DEAH box helicase [Odoribacter lunatus]
MKFNEMGLEASVLQGLDAMNFKETTPVQEKAIPIILEGKDIIGCAQTGTGKTAAYILPILNQMAKTKQQDDHINAIIMAPTRELAQQIDMQFEGFSYFVSISTLAIYGGGDGATWTQQKQGLEMGANVIIATPGRLITHLNMYNIDLSHVCYFILDEADRMLDMGFYDDIMKIAKKLPQNKQTIMFSATMPPKIQQLAKSILKNPAEINIAISKANEAITQVAYICYETQKMGLIKELFNKPIKSKSIIFSSSKQKVKELARILKLMQFNVAAMHSDLEQNEREKVMLDFKNNKITILVATDIVARGIDIEDIGTVLNFDVPLDPEDYIHRIGRTARANAEGLAITFVSEKEQRKFYRIEKFLEKDIYKIPLPSILGESPTYNTSTLSQIHHNRTQRKNHYPKKKGKFLKSKRSKD